ncbi:MAG: ABC transporter ATP-binding protein [Dehalococcoidia bacterium]
MYLEIKDVSVWFDTAQVLDKVNLSINEKELVGLVGPNGAGKSTILRTIAGMVKWERDNFKGTKAGRITCLGSITFDGNAISDLPAYKIAQMGLVICPERGRPFREMTIWENLKAGAYNTRDQKLFHQNLDKVYHLFPPLEKRKNQAAGTLSGGERTMLAIGRSLMGQAKLLMVDEPSTGLSPLLKEQLFGRLKDIHGMGLTILLVEQDVSYAFEIAARNYVLSKGHIVGEGTGEKLLADEFLRKVYLGL